MEVADMHYKTFAPYVNDLFTVHINSSETLEGKLTQVTPRGANDRSFSLIFQLPKNIFLPQAIYALEHRSLGVFSLFIVPVQEDEKSFYYQAIFNRDNF